MNRDFIEWLTTQRLPMFDISRVRGGELWTEGRFMDEAYEYYQRHPSQRIVFECGIDDLFDAVRGNAPQLRTPCGELALRTAIDDLRLNPWWLSAGPITEEIRFLLREGFKNLVCYQRRAIQASPMKRLFDHSRPQVDPS